MAVIVTNDQIQVDRAPSDPKELIRLQDAANSFYLGGGMKEDTIFAGKVTTGAGDKKAITVDASGNPITFTLTANIIPKVMYIKKGDRYYSTGMLIKDFGTGLQAGSLYFIQADGSLSTAQVTTSNLWSVVAGIAHSSTDFLVQIWPQAKNI